MTSTSYGTWGSYTRRASINDTVTEYLSGGGEVWMDKLINTGAFERIVDQFRAGINAALPDGVTLDGDVFQGPYPLPDGLRPADLPEIIRDVIAGVDLRRIAIDNDPEVIAAEVARRDSVSRQIGYAETYDDVYGLTFPGRYPAAGDSRETT